MNAQTLRPSFRSMLREVVKLIDDAPDKGWLQYVQQDVDKRGGVFVKDMGQLSAVFNNCQPSDDWSCALCASGLKPDSATLITGEIAEHDRVGLAHYPDVSIVAFRGTANVFNAGSDINALPTRSLPSSWRCRAKAGVHAGFYNVWKTLRSGLRAGLEAHRQKLGRPVSVIITGHSLGAAVSCICALDFSRSADMTSVCRVLANINFESPLVFTKETLNCYSVPTVRVTNSGDPVPHMPTHISGYTHVGAEVFLREGKATFCPPDSTRCGSSTQRWYSFWPLAHCTTKHYLGFDFCQCGGHHLQTISLVVRLLAVLLLGSLAFGLFKLMRTTIFKDAGQTQNQ